MPTLSDPALGLLIEIAMQWTASELRTLLMRADLDKYGEGGPNKQEMLRCRLLGARDAARDGNSDAHRALLTFVKSFIVKEVRRPNDPPSWFGELREAMRAD